MAKKNRVKWERGKTAYFDHLPDSWMLLSLLILSFSTRLLSLEYPPYVVFDETHFGKFVAGYVSGEYFFDIHPPLARLLLYASAAAAGFRPGFDFAFSSQIPPDVPLFALRFLPAFAGSLLVPLAYLVSRELLISRKASLLAALMVLFDNALIAESRFILIDIFVPFFSILALYLYLAGRRHTGRRGWILLALSAGAAGAAASSKWTGLAVLAFLFLLELADIRNRGKVMAAKRLFTLLSIPLLIYLASFSIHFSLLYKSGPGDAFMSDGFRKTLQGSVTNADSMPLNFLEKFAELNVVMWNSNAGIKEGHPYASRFYTWPLMYRPVYMWTNDEAYAYILGNPAVWWLSLACLIAAFSFLNPVLTNHRADRGRQKAMLIMLAFYLLNFLPFIMIGRVTFIYHYFTAFMASIIIACMMLDNLLFSGRNRYGMAIYLAIIAVIAIAFVYFSPLTYGTPLSIDELMARMWLPSWR